MIADHELVTAVVLMDVGIPHTLMEYLILALFGGGGAWKVYTFQRDRNGNDKLSSKLRGCMKEANKPLLDELKDLCKISEKTYAELHTYIEIQKDRDRRGGRV